MLLKKPCVLDGLMGKKENFRDSISSKVISSKQKSSWTELNKERARRLETLGLMTDEGRKALPALSYESFKIDPIILQRLKEDTKVHQNFSAFPDIYKRIRIDTIQSYKTQPELFNKRLDKFITNTKQNKMYGNWNDNGRLYYQNTSP